MNDPLLFFTGLFCFILALIGAVLTAREFKNIEVKEKSNKDRE